MKNKPLVLLLILVSLFSCKKDKNIPLPVDVYICGYYLNANNSPIACYWKNGEKVDVIDKTQDSQAFAIVVDQGIVYMAGMFNNQACYWIDGVRKELNINNQLYFGYASGIAIDQGALYFIGSGKISANSSDQPILWKKQLNQANPEMFLSFIPNIYLNEIKVKNSEVYIPGALNGKPGYWKNTWNDRHDLHNETAVKVPLLDFNNENIILCGTKTVNNQQVWGHWDINGFHSLGFNSSQGNITDMTISETGEIYHAGFLYNNLNIQKANYWVNGNQKDLNSPAESSAGSIALFDHYIFVGGNQGLSSGYWVNNQWIDLNTPDSEVYNIFLVKK